MARSLEQWHGANDDVAIPPRVKLRIWQRANGTCQGPCNRKLRPGDKVHFDHVVPLEDGGAHAEDNLQILCEGCHQIKTGIEATARARTRSIQKRHVGIKTPSKFPNARDGKWKTKIGGLTVPRHRD